MAISTRSRTCVEITQRACGRNTSNLLYPTVLFTKHAARLWVYTAEPACLSCFETGWLTVCWTVMQRGTEFIQLSQRACPGLTLAGWQCAGQSCSVALSLYSWASVPVLLWKWLADSVLGIHAAHLWVYTAEPACLSWVDTGWLTVCGTVMQRRTVTSFFHNMSVFPVVYRSTSIPWSYSLICHRLFVILLSKALLIKPQIKYCFCRIQ